MGWSVSLAGDVNADGFDDVLVGAPSQATDTVGGGRVFLYPGSSTGPAGSPAWSYESDQPGSLLGSSVSSAGDLNADGFADVVVGAPDYDGAFAGSGRVFVFYGSPAGLPPAPSISLDGPNAGARLGTSAAAVGDVNGDGFDDLAVAVPGFRNEYFLIEGRIFIYFGSAAGIPASPSRYLFTGPNYLGLTGPVSGAGDVNGDGLDDVIVRGNTSGSSLPTLYLYLGPLASTIGSLVWPHQGITGSPDPGNFSTVAGAGDLDGDGFDDVLLGGPSGEGKILLHSGSPSGLSTAPSWTARGGGVNANLGSSVAPGGDIDGDGQPDLIAGAPNAVNGPDSTGRVAVFFGTSDGPSLAPWWTPKSGALSIDFGRAVAGEGDVNGDAMSDLLVGAPGADGGFTNQGEARLYLGQPMAGPDVEAGGDQTFECTSPQGAVAALSGSAIPGSGGVVETQEWFKAFGTPGETLLGAGETIETPLALGTHLLTLRATDGEGNTGFDDLLVTVRDTAPPALAVVPSRSVLWPPNHRFVGVSVSLQSSDACGSSSVRFLAATSSEPADAPGPGDGSTSQDIGFPNVTPLVTDFSLRVERDDQGGGRVYDLRYRATDSTGNATEAGAGVVVPHDVNGVTEPLILHAEETAAGTVLRWSPVPDAIRYNVIRGDVASLRDQTYYIELGPIGCLAARLTAPDTSALPDPAIPAVGSAYFYLAEYNDGSRAGYGTVSAPKPRLSFGADVNCE